MESLSGEEEIVWGFNVPQSKFSGTLPGEGTGKDESWKGRPGVRMAVPHSTLE